MSGIIVNNVARASGTIAATPGGLDWSTAVVTASTVTVEAGKGYFINTTSNACTITLPASAEAGDQIVIADYARTWATNAVTLDSNGLNFQGEDDTYIVDYDTVGQSLNIVYSDSTKGWLPVSDDAVADVGVAPNQAIFAYGNITPVTNLSNLVNLNGVISSDTTGVGTARNRCAGANYGGDKGIFFGGDDGSARTGVSNLVSNLGVIASDTSAVGTGRSGQAGTGYGDNLAVFAYGYEPSAEYGTIRNLVSSSGVIASDATVAGGTGRNGTCGARYGTGTAIIGYGATDSGNLNVSNLVNSSGAVSADVTGVGDASYGRASASYGGDKAFFAYGYPGSFSSVKNLVNNSGVVASNVTGVGTARSYTKAASLGSFQTAIVAYGTISGGVTNVSNLVNNVGVIATDQSGVGTARKELAATEFGS